MDRTIYNKGDSYPVPAKGEDLSAVGARGAPINAPDNALILSSAAPGKVADDSEGQHSVLMAELLKNFSSPAASVKTVFNKTRIATSRASDGAQVPSVSSSLLEDVQLTSGANKSAERAGT